MAEKRFEPGTAISAQGRLLEFDDRSVIVISPHPRPRAWRISEDRGWHGVRPHIDLGVVDRVARCRGEPSGRSRRRAQVYGEIPRPLRLQVQRSSLRGQQWHMLSLLTRCPGADVLVDRSPLLAAALAASWFFRPPVTQPLRSARALLQRRPARMRCRYIAGWLGFEDSKAFQRVLARVIDPRRWSVRDLLALRALMAGSARKTLLHLKILNREVVAVLDLVAGDRGVDHHFVDMLSRAGIRRRERIWQHISRVYTDWILTFRTCPGEPFPRLRSWAQVSDLSDELELVRHRRSLEEHVAAHGGWPSPPMPGNGCIEPIRSLAQLQAEGRELQHCIAGVRYINDVLHGEGFAYRVRSGDQRATLWLVPDGGGCSEVGMIRGPRNERVSSATWLQVRTWLRARNTAVRACSLLPDPDRRVARPTVDEGEREAVPVDDRQLLLPFAISRGATRAEVSGVSPIGEAGLKAAIADK